MRPGEANFGAGFLVSLVLNHGKNSMSPSFSRRFDVDVATSNIIGLLI